MRHKTKTTILRWFCIGLLLASALFTGCMMGPEDMGVQRQKLHDSSESETKKPKRPNANRYGCTEAEFNSGCIEHHGLCDCPDVGDSNQ